MKVRTNVKAGGLRLNNRCETIKKAKTLKVKTGVTVVLFAMLLSAPVHSDVVNGDVNGDGRLDLADALFTVDWLFVGGPRPVQVTCSPDPSDISGVANGDVDGSSEINISDVVYVLNHLFSGGPEPVHFDCGDADAEPDGDGEGALAWYGMHCWWCSKCGHNHCVDR